MATPTNDSYSCASGGVIAGGRSIKTQLQIAAEALAVGSVITIANSSLNIPGTNGTLPWDKTGIGTSLPMLDWANDMPWDSVRHRAYASGGRDYSNPQAQKMVKFDAKTNVWESFIDPWQGGTGGHMWDEFDFASNHNLMLHVPYGNGRIHVWDTVTETNQPHIPVPPTDAFGGYDPVTTICWHPNLGPQGSIVWMNKTHYRIMRFDWATQVWSELKVAAPSGTDDAMVSCYLHGADVVVIGNSNVLTSAPFPALNVISNTGAWSATPPTPCMVSCNGTAGRGPLVAHPDGNSAIIFSLDDGHMYQWVASTNTWHDRGLTPAGLNTQYSVACSIPEYGVVMMIQSSVANAPFYCKLFKPGF